MDKIKTAAYCRVSTNSDTQDGSFEVQCAYYENLIKSDPTMEFVGVYGDHGKSGRAMKGRKELNRLIKDCEDGKIQLVLTKSISRFARNMLECVATVRHLMEIGVTVRFEKENLDTEKMGGELMLGILATIAQEESNSISQNMRWSRQKHIERGQPWDVPRYGYVSVGKEHKWEVVPHEAEVVRQAFYMAGMCHTYGEIAEELTRMEAEDGNGRIWNKTPVVNLLRSNVYIGEYLSNKECTIMTREGQIKRVKNHGHVDQILIEGHHEALVSRELYDDLYINGWSTTEIAELLTSYGRKTKLGNEVWNPTSIDGVIENERHCGDVRSRKTYTPDFKTHKSVKNRQNRKQYIQRNHHEAIVSRDVYNAANLLKSSHQYTAKSRPLPVLSVIDGGILTGYVPIDKNWSGFSTEDYQAACESVEVPSNDVKVTGRRLNMGGYQLVRSEFFPSIERPAMTISYGKLRFNTACLKKFEDVEYVELLLNTVKNCIAIRPCEKDNPNAIHWGRLREERWVVSTLGCKGLSRTLFDLMSWEDEGKYRFSGQYREQGDNKLLVFELGEPVITKTVEQIVVPEQPEEEGQDGQQEEIVIREKVRVFPSSWTTSFGVSISSIIHGAVLEQHHYAGDWDVLRPAKELAEMNIFTADQLDQLMKEAETIMEGWSKTA